MCKLKSCENQSEDEEDNEGQNSDANDEDDSEEEIWKTTYLIVKYLVWHLLNVCSVVINFITLILFIMIGIEW